MRRDQEAGGDLLAPRHRGAVRKKQHERDKGEGKGRGVKDVPALLSTPPLEQLFTHKGERYHQKLPRVALIFKPQKEVNAPNDRDRANPHKPRASSGP